MSHLTALKKKILAIVLPKSALVLYYLGAVWDNNLKEQNVLKLPLELLSLGDTIKKVHIQIGMILNKVKEV